MPSRAASRRAGAGAPCGRLGSLVQHLAVEVVRELEARGDRAVGPLGLASGADEAALPCEHAEDVLDSLLLALRRSRDRRRRELAADDARGFEQLPLVGAEPVELLLDQLAQRLREPARRLLVESGRRVERRRQRVDDERHEERVAARSCVQHPASSTGSSRPARYSATPSSLSGPRRSSVQPRRSAEVADQRRELTAAGRRVAAPERADHEQPCGLAPARRGRRGRRASRRRSSGGPRARARAAGASSASRAPRRARAASARGSSRGRAARAARPRPAATSHGSCTSQLGPRSCRSSTSRGPPAPRARRPRASSSGMYGSPAPRCSMHWPRATSRSSPSAVGEAVDERRLADAGLAR